MSQPHRGGLKAIALVLIVVTTSCSASTGRSAEPAASTTTTTAAPRPVLSPGQVDHVVGASFQYGSFVVTVGHTVYDPKTQQLFAGLRFHNTSEVWGRSAIAGTLELPGGGAVPFSGQPYTVPPGASIDATGSSSNVPTDPTSGGRLLWGSAEYAQPQVRLDGRGGSNLWLPAPVSIDGWAHIGKFGVHVTGGIVAASETNLGIQAPAHHRILRLLCDAFTNKGSISPFSARDNLLLQLPDGAKVDAVDGSRAGGQLSWLQQGGNWSDFPIPDDQSGSYRVLVASIPKVSLASRPALIQRRPIPFTLPSLHPGAAPTGAPPMPDLTAPGAVAHGTVVDRDLSVGAVNVPGFTFRPTHLHWDPAAGQVRLDGVATDLASATAGPGGALVERSGLGAAPMFGFTEVLVSRGRASVGIVAGSAAVDPDHPTPLALSFSSVTRFDPDDAALFLGPANAAASSLPLGASSTVPAYPPPPSTVSVDAATVSAGSWSVRFRAARLGLLVTTTPPQPGQRNLEITFDVTAASDAKANAFGISFSPQYQILLAGPSGYDTEAVAGPGGAQQKPGQTLRYTVTFEVPDTFSAGRLAFVLRSRSEVGDLTTSWVETRFNADIGAVPNALTTGAAP